MQHRPWLSLQSVRAAAVLLPESLSSLGYLAPSAFSLHLTAWSAQRKSLQKSVHHQSYSMARNLRALLLRRKTWSFLS